MTESSFIRATVQTSTYRSDAFPRRSLEIDHPGHAVFIADRTRRILGRTRWEAGILFGGTDTLGDLPRIINDPKAGEHR
ncbi:hypothetical protein AB0D67_36230 [Streptosporangium sp. NPDC048047]|uniref:hypothetical protein n=1 Tax=Streptosporangium sp. NPDC048047 TaxID=3155748 RepID=UPI003421D471